MDGVAISQRLVFVIETTSEDAGGSSLGRLIVNRSIEPTPNPSEEGNCVKDSSGSLTK